MCLDGEAEDAALAGYGDEGLDAQASDDRSVKSLSQSDD